MPRPSKGARLYLRKRKGRAPIWVIRDEGGAETSTGTGSRPEAESILADYIGHKYRPNGPVDAHELTISQALLIYAEDHAPDLAAAERVAYAIEALEPFWGPCPSRRSTATQPADTWSSAAFPPAPSGASLA